MPGFGNILFFLVFGLGSVGYSYVGEVSESEDAKLESLFPSLMSLAVNVQSAALASSPQTARIVFKRIPVTVPTRSPVAVAPAVEIDSNFDTNVPAVPTISSVSAGGSSERGLVPGNLSSNFVSSAPIGEVVSGSKQNEEYSIEPSTLPGNSGTLLNTLGSFGRLPIPMAQVTPGSYIQNNRPWGPDAEQFSDLVGSAGSSFGKSRADGTFDSLRENAKKKSDSIASSDPLKNKKLTPEERKKKEDEEKKKEEEKLAQMEENMEKFEQGITPFDTDEYPAYQEARDQFFRDDQKGELLGGLLKGKEALAEKMVNLFNKNARMDEDTFQTNGKENFKRFIESRMAPSLFPVGRPGAPLHEPSRH